MIHMEKLTKSFGEIRAVDAIDLDVRKGEITGLLGPNGAGKTTTMRMLTGYMEPTSGSIRVRDIDVCTDAKSAKRLMGYLPESAPLYPNMLVFDYLSFVARVKGIPAGRSSERIEAMVDLCSLDDIMHRPIGELSKGLKQRVGLAHAMIDDPEILVLDEPTSGLDPNQIVEIRDIIRSIGRDKTVILSTHILSEAEAACDRIVIIDRGRIVADGSTEMLTRGPGRQVVIRLVMTGAAADEALGVLSGMDGVTGMEAAPGEAEGELALLVRASGDTDPRPEIYRRIRDTGWVLLEMSREGASLEKVFRELTGEA
jgi:ABC-2 type transport system ATP-binding protein